MFDRKFQLHILLIIYFIICCKLPWKVYAMRYPTDYLKILLYKYFLKYLKYLSYFVKYLLFIYYCTNIYSIPIVCKYDIYLHPKFNELAVIANIPD